MMTALRTLPPTLVLAAWLITMVSIPILQGVWGERARTRGVSVGVILQAGAVVAVLGPTWGWLVTARTAILIAALGWLAEFVGSHTGVPFGPYAYTEKLHPQIGGVPLIIPIAWLMMMPPAWAIGTMIADQGSGPAFVLASALAFTAWDLFLDPQMVTWGFWVWDEARAQYPRYFGIPWTNYAGWFGVSALITWFARPTAVAIQDVQAPLLLIYGLTWALETFGQLVFWDLKGPALAGAAGMGLCLILALT